MSNMPDPQTNRPQQMIYQFRIEGHLSPLWEVTFEGLTIRLEEGGETLLTGPVADQAALHGLLRKFRDLGLPLVSVTRLRPESTDFQ